MPASSKEISNKMKLEFAVHTKDTPINVQPLYAKWKKHNTTSKNPILKIYLVYFSEKNLKNVVSTAERTKSQK